MIHDVLAFAFIAIVLGISIWPVEDQLQEAFRRKKR